MPQPSLLLSLLIGLLSCGLGACGEEPPPDPPVPTACADHLDCAASEFYTSKVCTDAAGQRHDLGGHKKELRSSELKKPKISSTTAEDELGDHEALVLTYEDSASVSLVWRAAYYKKSGAFVFRLGIKNNGSAKVVVDKLAPVRSRGSAGGGLKMVVEYQ